MRAYKKSGTKKIYGKYSESKKIKIVSCKPMYQLNNIIFNKVEDGSVVTEFSITIDSKCAPVYLSNLNGANNRVIRYFGIDDILYNNAQEKLKDVMTSKDKDIEDLSDEMLRALQGQYQFASMTPSNISVDGTMVEKGSTKKLEAGKTYTIRFAKSADALCPYLNVNIKVDEYNYPAVKMEYE